MIFKISKGFTLIELLVVIAIIGVLSSIVLANLNGARTGSIDATIKTDLMGTRAQAELFQAANSNSFMITAGGTTDVCSSSGSVGGVRGIYANVFAAAAATGLSSVNTNAGTTGTIATATCHSSAGSWAAEAPLKTGGMFCTDSTTAAVVTAGSTLGPNDYVCN